jgi:hypothetical protein
MSTELDRRGGGRVRVESAAELIWRDDSGLQQWEQGQVFNVSATGMAINCPKPVTPASCLIVDSQQLGIAALAQVRHCAWLQSQYRFGVQLRTEPVTRSSDSPNHQDLMRAGLAGDMVAFERLYRSLSFRFHPDNQDTGDPEVFLQIREIHRILSVATKSGPQPEFAAIGQVSAASMQPSKQRRIDVLRMLYERKVEDCYSCGVPQNELQATTGLPGNELQFILWYLREKGAVIVGDSQVYSISATGVDLFDEAHAG